MPFHKRVYFHPRGWAGTRSVAARRIQRAFRSRYRKKKRVVYKKKNYGRPTIRGKSLPAKNARLIRKLLSEKQPKYVLRSLYNQLIFTNADWNSKLCLTDIPSLAGIPDPLNTYNYREDDDTHVNLKTIRVSFTIHASPIEGVDIQKYYVALIKTTNNQGGPDGIELPTPQKIFDPSSCEYDNQVGQTSLLAPWEGFRRTHWDDDKTDYLKNTTILKSWEGFVSPTQIHRPQRLQIDERQSGGPFPTAPVLCTGDLDTTAYDREENMTALGSSFPNVVKVRYTHKCLGAKLKFENSASSNAVNVKYYLVTLASGTVATTGYRINACCKVNFTCD